MYINNKLEIELKNRIKNNEISEAVSLLEKKIKLLYVRKIQKFNKSAKYIDIITLKEDVEKYLSLKEAVIFKKFFVILNTNMNDLYQLERMTEIYNILKKEGLYDI